MPILKHLMSLLTLSFKISMVTAFSCFMILWSGCAVAPKPLPEPVVTLPTVEEQIQSSGSIWRDGLTDCYADRRASRVGDILTVNIIESAEASQEATTSTDRNSKMDTSISDLFGLPNDMGMTNFLQSKAPFSPSLNGEYDRQFGGKGSTTRKDKLAATITVKIIEVLQSGNFRIQVKRSVKVNREKQMICLEGTIRPEDISPTNTIASTYIADAQITYSGRGVIGDTQGPGWLMRVMDWIWPM